MILCGEGVRASIRHRTFMRGSASNINFTTQRGCLLDSRRLFETGRFFEGGRLYDHLRYIGLIRLKAANDQRYIFSA